MAAALLLHRNERIPPPIATRGRPRQSKNGQYYQRHWLALLAKPAPKA